MFALLADEDFDNGVLAVIERVAWDYGASILIRRVVDIGVLGEGSSDPAILDFAANADCVVITHDRETMPHHADERAADGLVMAGLVVVSQFSGESPVAHALIEMVLDRERTGVGWHYQVEWL